MIKKNLFDGKKKWIFLVIGLIIVIIMFGEVTDDNSNNDISKSKSTELKDKDTDNKKASGGKDKEKEEKEKKKDKKKEKKKDKKKYKELKDDFDDLIEGSNGIILDIRPNPHTESYQQMEVEINAHVWEESSETDKLEFAEALWSTIAGIIYENNILDKGKTINMTLYDSNNYELATQSIMSGKFDIKR